MGLSTVSANVLDAKVIAAAPPFYPRVTRENIPKLFEVEKVEKNVYSAHYHGDESPLGNNIYGGLLNAQAMIAAQRSVPDGFVPHSVHNYFVAFPSNRKPVDYKVTQIRDGRNLCTRFVTGVQNDKVIFTSSASFCQKEEPSIFHQLPMPQVPPPESLKDFYDLCREYMDATDTPRIARGNARRRLMDEEFAIVEVRPVDPDMTLMLRPYSPMKTHYSWTKCVIPLSDTDESIHRAMTAYMMDSYLAGTVAWPHGR